MWRIPARREVKTSEGDVPWAAFLWKASLATSQPVKLNRNSYLVPNFKSHQLLSGQWQLCHRLLGRFL